MLPRRILRIATSSAPAVPLLLTTHKAWQQTWLLGAKSRMKAFGHEQIACCDRRVPKLQIQEPSL
jgi:hypothetical protein